MGFSLDRPWRLHPDVALRPEPFGALAYHYTTRRLTFLQSIPLVELIEALDQYPSARAALEDRVRPAARAHYETALARLASSEVIDVR
jgi:mycofactocin biosynthesis protein MftB